MTERQIRIIKRMIRTSIASTEKIDNLHHVDQEQINRAFDTKDLYDYEIKMDKMNNGEIYFAFVSKTTGYYYTTCIIGRE